MDENIRHLIRQDGGWYKANLHCHTILSDGSMTPEQCKQAYKQQGYSIIAFTDHNKYEYHKELCDESFLAIAACEIDINKQKAEGESFNTVKTYHFNLYDTNPSQREQANINERIKHGCNYDDIDGINSYISRMKAQGFLVCYNHPYWSLQDKEDYAGLENLWGCEIYNHGCEHDGLYGYNPHVYAQLLRQSHSKNTQPIFALATDDNHNRTPLDSPRCDSFGGFVMINAQKLEYAAIISALKSGQFYSSMGPLIKEMWIEKNVLHVHTTPVEKIFLHGHGRDCMAAFAKKGESITSAQFTLDNTMPYFYIECKDSCGLFANTNAFSSL